jgi:hypothetical protein
MGMGYGAAQGLEQVLERLYRDQMEKTRAAEEQRRFEAEGLQRQAVQDRWMTDRTDRQREKATEQAGFESYVNSLPAHLQSAARGRQFGVTLSPDDFVNPPETRDAAAARGLAELAAELETRQRFKEPKDPALIWQTRPDGSEVRVPDAPGVISARRAGNLRMIDPSFPSDVQRQVMSLRHEHPTFEAAVAAANQQFDAWQQKHPQLQATKVLDALRQSYTGSGQRSPMDDLLSEVLGPSGTPSASGRATGAGSRPTASSPDAALQEAARQVIQQAGHDPTPENVAKFLANPRNRAKLTGARP